MRVRRSVDAPAERAWAVVADIEQHPSWQVDLRSVTFSSPRRSGLGAAYECDTRLGPIRMRIPMVVTRWKEGRSVEVRYEGTLSGSGRLEVERRWRRRSRVTWSARITFPWWLGGPAGAFAAAQVLRAVWRANLRNLERIA